jgi:ribonuclease R
MSKRFSERILDHLRQPGYRPLKQRPLARAMGIAEEEYGEFREAVDSLRRVGRVILGSNSAIMLPQAPATLVGTFRANPRGFGFVVPDEPDSHADLFIAPGDSLDALTGDKVMCRVVKRGKRAGRDSLGGQVLRILQRGNNRFVGRLQRENSNWFVMPDGNTLQVPIFVGDPGAKSSKSGDQVVVEIVRYPSDGRPAQGVIIERLGRSGERGVDLLSIVRQHLLPDEFPDSALAQARSAIRAFDPDKVENREDLSGETIITIDPDTARDFDDAISLRRLAESERPKSGKRRQSGRAGRPQAELGGAAWELGVHIADVSTFVTSGGALDAEAEQRGNSVYFPLKVIPMLPEVLSNGVCSLQEGEPRLCKSAFIQYDADGNVVGARFANTVIRSAKRLTYGQATEILEGKTGGYSRGVVSLLKDMDSLARTIRERRLRAGMIVLDLPEVELLFDDNEQVIDAEPADTSFSHTIIEMFMVEANEAVARLLRSLEVPFLRRIHPDPDADSIEAVMRFLKAAGHPIPKRFTHADLQNLLAEVRGRPESYAVSLAVLKSMETAEYSPKEIGHYALASDCYSHFTSPIRRYPDLMVHRLLQMYLDGDLRKGRLPDGIPSDEDLKEVGRQMSFLSRRAETAEREYRTLKVLQLLSRHVGETFEGVITGVTNFGLFVQFPKYLIDGLLRLEDLGDDWWEVDVQSGRIRGERSRTVLAIGQVVTVQIDSVDLANRQLKLALAQRQSVASRAPRSPEPAPIRRNARRSSKDQVREKRGRRGGAPKSRSGRRQ